MRGAIPPPQYFFMTLCLLKHRENFDVLDNSLILLNVMGVVKKNSRKCCRYRMNSLSTFSKRNFSVVPTA
jgi:hypothetical protein